MTIELPRNDLPQWAENNPAVIEHFGLWCINENVLRAAADHFQGHDVLRHVAQHQGTPLNQTGESVQTTQRIAVVSIHGVLMKRVSSMADGTSSVRARRQIREAVSDPDVAAIILHVDSPGGTAAGTSDLAAEIRDAGRSKPVWAFIEDLSASAAYWVASAAQRVIANDVSALVGSIGTYQVIHDSSEMANQLGVKVHVIRAGDLKGVGTPGTEVTESHLAEFQRLVNAVNESFLSGVSQGRRLTMERVQELADGRLFTANEALNHKLIDVVQSWDRTINELSSQSQQRRSKGTKTMTSTPDSPATLSQLRQFCAGADDSFLLDQIEKQSPLSEALASWAVKQQETIAQMKNDLKESKTLVSVESTSAPLKPLRTIGGTISPDDSESPWDNDDAKSAFDREVRARLRPGATMQQRHAAIAYVARTQPALHQASIAADNPSKKSRRMLEEKYESSAAK